MEAKIAAIVKDFIDIENPETVSIMLSEIFSDGKDIQATADFINALKICEKTTHPWTNIFVFENVVDALTGNPVDTTIFTVPALDDIAVAVNIMNKSQEGRQEFSDEVKKYIATRAKISGVLWLIPPLDIANEYLVLKEDDAGYAVQNDLVKWLSQNDIEKINPEELEETALDIQLYKLFRLVISIKLAEQKLLKKS